MVCTEVRCQSTVSKEDRSDSVKLSIGKVTCYMVSSTGNFHCHVIFVAVQKN